MIEIKEDHFWYSQKQSINLSESDRSYPINYAMIDGKEVVYTTWNNNSKDSGCAWDDMEYLGKGKWFRCHGYW